jgi:hypothetical protein
MPVKIGFRSLFEYIAYIAKAKVKLMDGFIRPLD